MSRGVAVSLLLFLMATTGSVDAYRPVLHERVPVDAREDAILGATTLDGKLPSALATPSGVVGAPDTKRAPNHGDVTYSETVSTASQANTYEADRNTRSPNSVGYTEPFTPSVAPYKRLQVFDAVLADERLGVRNPAVSRISMGGEPDRGDDLFFGDMTVDLTAGLPVRIPSVASGARVLRLSTVPAMPIELLRDEAENWFLRGPKGAGRVRLLLELSAPRASFGGPVQIGRLSPGTAGSLVAENVARDAARVARAIGITGSMTLDQVLETMVTYFRGFVASEVLPSGRQNVYLDLALSRKGVCRHRAYAFVVTALGLGLPARMVTNEAHAWVEVRGADQLWHRVDLGGAAGEISVRSDPRPAYQAPEDTFAWPAAAERFSGAHVLTSLSASTPGGTAPSASSVVVGPPGGGAQLAWPGPTGGGASPSGGPAVASPERNSTSAGMPSPALSGPVAPMALSSSADRSSNGALLTDPSTETPRAIVSVRAERQVERGGPLAVDGRVHGSHSNCPDSLVQVVLRPQSDGPAIPVGSLVPRADGSFSGTLYVPQNVTVGTYDISATVVASSACASE